MPDNMPHDMASGLSPIVKSYLAAVDALCVHYSEPDKLTLFYRIIAQWTRVLNDVQIRGIKHKRFSQLEVGEIIDELQARAQSLIEGKKRENT